MRPFLIRILILIWAAAGILADAQARTPSNPPVLLDRLDSEVRRAVTSVLPAVVRVDATPNAATSESDVLHFSGLSVDEGEYVITVSDAVVGTARITVRARDGVRHEAIAVGHDSSTGVAVLRLANVRLPSIPVSAPFATGDLPASFARALPTGSLIITVGNPYGLAGSPSLGMMSGLRRMKMDDGSALPMMQIASSVHPGDYGGAVVDARGRVVGMVTSSFRDPARPSRSTSSGSSAEGEMTEFFLFLRDAQASARERGDVPPSTEALFFRWLEERAIAEADERDAVPAPAGVDLTDLAFRRPIERNRLGTAADTVQGIHFALPIERVLQSARRILSASEQSRMAAASPLPMASGRPWLGVRVEPTVTTLTGPAPKKVQGLRVVGVSRGGPAEIAGIRQSDVLTQFNDASTSTAELLHDALMQTNSGEKARVVILRNGARLTFTLDLRKDPLLEEEDVEIEIETEGKTDRDPGADKAPGADKTQGGSGQQDNPPKREP